jgi:NitT/TauT family transport system substrate-binding protein
MDKFLGVAVGSPQSAPLEKPRLRVGILPIVDSAGFQIAMDKGYFKEEGLDIEIVPIQGGRAATPKLTSGELDITWGNWVSYMDAQARREADLALLTDGYQADEGMFLTVAMPGRNIKRPEDLRGKKIAVNTRNNIVEFNLLSTLQSHGVRQQDVQLVEVPFPQMPEKLRTGEVDAISVLEPFLSKANQLGAQTVMDTAEGPTQDIPIAGFSSTKQFATENPNTVAAFQRAMIRGQTLASENRDEVEEVLPKFTDTDPKTASLIRLGTFPRRLDLTRLDRIKTLMQVRGLLPANFEVGPMIIPAPPEKR